jgi:hypothetical protein
MVLDAMDAPTGGENCRLLQAYEAPRDGIRRHGDHPE